jgi:hypothetical protein
VRDGEGVGSEVGVAGGVVAVVVGAAGVVVVGTAGVVVVTGPPPVSKGLVGVGAGVPAVGTTGGGGVVVGLGAGVGTGAGLGVGGGGGGPWTVIDVRAIAPAATARLPAAPFSVPSSDRASAA